jgi:hypothetical protein
MYVVVRGLIKKCVFFYLDDITIYSKNRVDNISHLIKIFERCRKYEIYLNPKKTIFRVVEGKILGHIISKYGINIDLERVKEIS